MTVGPFCWRQQNGLKPGCLYFCSLHGFFSIFFNKFFLLAFFTSSSVILPPASPPPAPLTVIQGHRTTPSALNLRNNPVLFGEQKFSGISSNTPPIITESARLQENIKCR
jgi:hypothetical protein